VTVDHEQAVVRFRRPLRGALGAGWSQRPDAGTL